MNKSDLRKLVKEEIQFILKEEMDGVAIVDMSRDISNKLNTPEEHAGVIQNLLLNAYQTDVAFTANDISKIEKALNLLKQSIK